MSGDIATQSANLEIFF